LSTHFAITEMGKPAATCSVMKVSRQLYGVVFLLGVFCINPRKGGF
jgi:hypothetical protein